MCPSMHGPFCFRSQLAYMICDTVCVPCFGESVIFRVRAPLTNTNINLKKVHNEFK